MPERIYQFRFDEPPEDVTPQNFAGLKFDKGRPLSRFVREVRESVRIHSPTEAAHYLLSKVFTPFEQFEQEEMWVLLLNTKAHVTHEVMIYRGTVNTIDVREAEVLKEAVRLNAPSLILSHVHPSGDASPSPEDVQVSRRIHQAAKLLGLSLLDHIIIGKDSWVSLKERKLGFEDS